MMIKRWISSKVLKVSGLAIGIVAASFLTLHFLQPRILITQIIAPALDPFGLATSETIFPKVEINMDRREFLAGEAITGRMSTFPRVGGDLQVMLIPHPRTAPGLELNEYWLAKQIRFLGRNEEIIRNVDAAWWTSQNRLISIGANDIPSGEYRLKFVFSKEGCPRLETPSVAAFGWSYSCRDWSTSELSDPIRIRGAEEATDKSIVSGLSHQGWRMAWGEIAKTMGKASTSIRPEREVVSRHGNIICTKQTYSEPLRGKVTACIDRNGIFGNSRFFFRDQTTFDVEGFQVTQDVPGNKP